MHFPAQEQQIQLGTRQGTPWTSHWFITGPTYRDKQQHIHIHTDEQFKVINLNELFY